MSTKAQDPGQGTYTDEVMVVEPHSIDHIPDNERHGKPYLQGTIWFAAQMRWP